MSERYFIFLSALSTQIQLETKVESLARPWLVLVDDGILFLRPFTLQNTLLTNCPNERKEMIYLGAQEELHSDDTHL